MIKQSELKEKLDYNQELGIFTWKLKSAFKKIGSIAGYKNLQGYIIIKINKKMYPAHRLVCLYVYGYLPKIIDHINGIKDDNRIINLRPATSSQNQWNRKLSKNNTSGIKGVTWNTHTNKWLAQTTINGKNKYLGYFEDIELAELVVQEARNKYHGEFARDK